MSKIAGAMAEDGKQLEEIAEAARNAVKVMGNGLLFFD